MFSSRFAAFFWIFALFLVQNTWTYLFPEKAPALVLIGVLYYSLFEGAAAGFMAGAWGGLLIDLFSQGRPGFFTAAFALSGAVSGIASSKIFEDSWLTEIILPFLSLYCVMLVQQFVLRTRMGEPAGFAAFFEAFLPWPLFMTAVCAPWFFTRLRKLSPRQRRRWTARA